MYDSQEKEIQSQIMQQRMAEVKSATKEEPALIQAIQQVRELTGMLASINSDLSAHADRVFGSMPEACDDEKVSQDREGAMGELQASLARLADEVSYTSRVARRNCKLA